MPTRSKQQSTRQPAGNGHPAPRGRISDVTKRNVESISRIEEQLRGERGTIDKAIDAITAFCGSTGFVYFHLVWYGGWLIANTLLPEPYRFDKFPFTFLTLVVSLEAIFLSTFILISQNRQAQITELRSHLDLQINLLDEQETTRVLRMLERIEKKLGIQEADAELKELEREVEPEDLVSQIEHVIEAMQKNEVGRSGRKPARSRAKPIGRK